ncbi:MAG: N-acetylmuramoyl-L-alanine amidase family protein [Planctomycetota bacterium]
MRPRNRLAFALMATLLAAALTPGVPRAQSFASEVLADTDRGTGREALYTSDRGLVLRAPQEPDLSLGTGCDARFAADGALWFWRSVDDGHAEIARQAWVLDPGHRQPRPARAAEVAPPPPSAGSHHPLSNAIKVCLDPGHGGTDPGALGNGLRETDINLDVVLRLRDLMLLDSQNPSRGGVWDVLLTRSTDVTTSLGQRTSAANAFGAASFVSVHMNAFSSATANGTETFCYPGTENGASGALRGAVHVEAITAWGRTDRGVKSANFFVLRNTSMPATLLEGAFITNAGDAAVMALPDRRQDLARAILFGLQRHHGFSTWDPGTGAPTSTVRGLVWDATRGPLSPVAGALVSTAVGEFTTTGSDGSYELTVPAAALTGFAATAAGFESSYTLRPTPQNTIVSVNFALAPGAVAALTLSPADPTAGVPLVARTTCDPGASAFLLVSLNPGVPGTDLRAFGLGQVWPELATSVVLSLGAGNPTGNAVGLVPTPPVPGLVLHAQALAAVGGTLRLSQGAAARLR